MKVILGILVALTVGLQAIASENGTSKTDRKPSNAGCREVAMAAAIDKLWTSSLEGQGSNKKEQISALIAGFQFNEHTKKYSVCVITSNGWDQALSYKVTLHADGGYENCFVDAVDAFTCSLARGPTEHP